MQFTVPTLTARACAGMAAAAAMLLATTASAWAATYTVDTFYDDDLGVNANFCLPGEYCTLRAALQRANQAPGPHTIKFNLPLVNGSTAVIYPQSQLPAITREVYIDGLSQPGSAANTLPVGDNAVVKVVIDGKDAGDAHGLVFNAGADGSSVQHVMVVRFQRSGVWIDGPNLTNISVLGNFIGTNGSGDANDLAGNWSNGAAWAAVVARNGAANSRIGDASDPAFRNLLGGKSSMGVAVVDATNIRVENNYIGTSRSGNERQPLTTGVSIMRGASTTVKNNVIGAQGVGVEITGLSMGNTVASNRIGIGTLGANTAGSGPGVFVSDNGLVGAPIGNAIGSTNAGNTIANWGGPGIAVVQVGTQVAQLTEILSNSIYGNGGLGIELVNQKDGIGAGPNAANPTPGVNVNGGQVFPVITNATANGAATALQFTYGGATGDWMEVFANPTCDPSGYGQGQTLLTGAAASGGSQTFSLPGNLAGQWLTMTATSDGRTSEFSACMLVVQGNAGAGTPPVMNPIPDVALPVGTYQELSLPNMVTPTDGDTITGYALSGPLPPGMGFVSATGILSGTPTTPGTYTLQATATDKDGTSAPRSFTVTVTAQQGGGGGNPGDPGGNPGGPGGPGGNVAAVPTLGHAGLALLSACMAGMGALRRRRR